MDKMNRFAKEWLEALVEALIILCVLFFVCWPVKIDGASMEETFHTNDRVVISKALVIGNKINRGDIVVCKIEADDKRHKIIKRLIGLPGDHVKIEDGKVIVNDKVLEEPYEVGYTDGSVDLLLKANEVFVLGDNRGVSYDSRKIGPIAHNKILGKVLFRFFPFNKISSYL